MEGFKSIFKGQRLRKIYFAYKTDCFRCDDTGYKDNSKIIYLTEEIGWIDIYECYIDKPPLKVGDEIYINEIDKTVTISRAVRTTNGEMIYYINNYEIIEDEKSLETKLKAEKEIEQYRAIIEEKNKKLKEQLNTSNKKHQNKKWYQFWK